MARSLRSARILAPFAGALATALAACSLLTGLDADYKSRAAPGGDSAGGTDGSDGDDAKNDTNTFGDGALDSGGDGNVPSAFCASVDAGSNGFCWDFEGPGTAPKWGWSDSLLVQGSLTVVEGIGVNKSRALRASITNPGAASGHAFLHENIAGSKFTDFNHHEMLFSYAITKGTPLYGAALGALGFGTGNGQYIGASIYGPPPGAVGLSDPPGNSMGTSIPVTLGEWRRVRIALDRSGPGPYTTTVTIDGKAVQDTPPPFAAGPSTSPTQVWVGTFFSSMGAGGVEALIDNVLVSQSN